MGGAIKIPSKDRWPERSLPARQEAATNWSRPLRTRLGRGGAHAVLGGGEAAYKGPRGFLERPPSLREERWLFRCSSPSFFFFYVFSQTQSLVDHMKTVSQERVPFLATLQVLCKAACPFDLAGLWLTNYGGKSALQHHKCLSKLMGRISYYLLPR